MNYYDPTGRFIIAPPGPDWCYEDPYAPGCDVPGPYFPPIDAPTGNDFASASDAAAQAKKTAGDDLGKTSCYKLLGFASAAAAQDWFNNRIHFNYIEKGRLVLKNGVPAGGGTPAPADTIGLGTININIDYSWGDFSKVPTATGLRPYNYLGYINSQTKLNMTSDQLGVAIIIHELEHQLTVPKKSDAEDNASLKAIYDNCVK